MLMRRNRRLVQEQRHALEVAGRLEHATDATLRAAIEGFRAYWEGEGEEQLAAEEQILLPALAEPAQHGEAISDVLLDHLTLRHRASRLLARTDWPDLLEQAHALGACIAEHFRREERVLLPLLERALSADELAELADRLENAPVRVVSRAERTGTTGGTDPWPPLSFGPLPGPGYSDGG